MPSTAGAALRSAPAYGLGVIGAVLLWCTVATAAAPPDPSVRLYDTVTSVPSRAARVSKTAKWIQVREGDLTHRFTGDAVLMNDRVAIGLRANPTRGALEVYRITPDGWNHVAYLGPPHGLRDPTAARIVENNGGAVELEATCQKAIEGAHAYRVRLTAGQPLLEVRPGPGLSTMALSCGPGHGVVPDFFGDDIVFDARMSRLARAGLPAENAFLSLSPHTTLMCVSERAGQNVDVFSHVGGIHFYNLECAGDKRLWVAVLEGPGLCNDYQATDAVTPRKILRNFTPPFPAKWRASFVGTDGVCDSITFEQPPEKAPVPEDWRGPVIFYPIDRSRTTPLTTILPMDVLRSTLGVGPCEYILDLEGLAGDDPAPPDAVVGWIERLVKKKRAARSAAEIEERLDAMLAHLAAARARIDDYAAFGKQVRHVCREAAKQDAEKEAAAAVLRICDRLDHDLARGRAQMKTPADAARLAREIAALIEKPDALTGFEAPGKALRAIGHAFDATLARSRMAARRMKAYSRSAKSDLATTVQTMAERMLRRK